MSQYEITLLGDEYRAWILNMGRETDNTCSLIFTAFAWATTRWSRCVSDNFEIIPRAGI